MGAVSGDEVKIHAVKFDIITQTLDLLKDGGFNDVTIICRMEGTDPTVSSWLQCLK